MILRMIRCSYSKYITDHTHVLQTSEYNLLACENKGTIGMEDVYAYQSTVNQSKEATQKIPKKCFLRPTIA